MTDFAWEQDLAQELSEIPAEYQDIFRQTLTQELAETAQDRTDTDILRYLRQRRDDFERGGFIRPDGRPGMMTLSREMMYEQALPALARNTLGEANDASARRRTVIKGGVFVAALFMLLLFVVRGRTERTAAETLLLEATATAEPSVGTPIPTPPLPTITGVEESLQTIGSLGGALTIGRPSSLEIEYGRTGETIALAIDPSKPTPKGEMRYNETTMRSDNPVAVWLFGTVLNYAIGIPDSMIRNLVVGDRLRLNTDTGAALNFVVAETGEGATHDAGRLLSQNRLGVTLFALPATSADGVAFAFAQYDLTGESGAEETIYGVGEPISLYETAVLTITAVSHADTRNGDIRIVVEGELQKEPETTAVMLTLIAGQEQTTAVALAPDETGRWQTTLVLPRATAETPLYAELRPLPMGDVSLVQLGQLPAPWAQLDVNLAAAWWDAVAQHIVLQVNVTSDAVGDVFVADDFIQLIDEGGDEYEWSGQVTPHLPLLIHPGETVGMLVTFLPNASSVRVQIGADLWVLSGYAHE